MYNVLDEAKDIQRIIGVKKKMNLLMHLVSRVSDNS
jgi:hypothetical protein